MTALLRALRGSARALLGLFVLGQLAFLGVANFAKVAQHFQSAYKDEPAVHAWLPEWAEDDSRLNKTIAGAGKVASRYADLIEQPQSWSLFAPGVWEQVPFLAVEFRWDDEPPAGEEAPDAGDGPPAWVYLRSDNEPKDPHAYFRVGKYRLRRYESNVGEIALRRGPDESPDDVALAWHDRIQKLVREEGEGLRAYLVWRWERYRERRPGRPRPKQFVLWLRTYHVPRPGTEPWDWRGPDQVPLMRWRPAYQPEPGYLPVEVYDPLSKRFDPLSR
ncbi:MAG TPA: hypothetical protein VFA26_09110 [Gemmataceae bacterium]|nr:hypothetical protein [Gemmataceae bacterium]